MTSTEKLPPFRPRVPRFRDIGAKGGPLEQDYDLRIHRKLPSRFGRMTDDELRQLKMSDAQDGEKPKYPFGLTQKELEIATLLGQGRSYREIALKMGIKPDTVNTRIPNIRKKMGLTELSRKDFIAQIPNALMST